MTIRIRFGHQKLDEVVNSLFDEGFHLREECLTDGSFLGLEFYNHSTHQAAFVECDDVNDVNSSGTVMRGAYDQKHDPAAISFTDYID